MNIAAVVL